MSAASAEDIAELLGDRADDTIVERIANVGATLDEVTEALDDYEDELRFGEERLPSSVRVEEVRTILEELPAEDSDLAGEVVTADEDEDEDEGLRVVEADELEQPERP
ncbi:MAG: hypothetical protein KF773_03525 [Deltaproteobacteria bacterium]|nr:hypothetical protein [Deltaproteobacteria bacterium]MCW5801643.1 hypothetical protein [Deltaproteobacteria bacterium]